MNWRTREVGIRVALGAKRRDLLLLILRNASVLIVCGLGLGLMCTWLQEAETLAISAPYRPSVTDNVLYHAQI